MLLVVEALVNENLVGRCGLYCGSCIIYRAHRDSIQLRQLVADHENCRPEDVRCEGCQTVLTSGWNEDQEWGRHCRIVKCLEDKGLDFCYQCDIYPDCEKFLELGEIASKMEVEDLMENLEKIKAGKVAEWLEEEDMKWRCHECGKPVSRHLQECHWCGAELL
jgi:hypothetical protein